MEELSLEEQRVRAWFFQALADSYTVLEQEHRVLLQELGQTSSDRAILGQILARHFREIGLLVKPGGRRSIGEIVQQEVLAGCLFWFLVVGDAGLVNLQELEEWTTSQKGWYGAPQGEEDASSEETNSGSVLPSLQSGNARAWRKNPSRRPGRSSRGD